MSGVIISAGVIGSVLIGGVVVKIYKATRSSPNRDFYGWFAEGTDIAADPDFNTLEEAVNDAELRLSE